MTQPPQTLRIVVASPSDVRAERDALEKVIEEINHGVAALAGLRLELSRWEKDAFPGFHPDGPQGLIDPILRIPDCDLLVGIFWKRFGTAHEFHTAYEAWKRSGHPQIMVYFNQRAYTPQSRAEAEQWGQVLEFKQNFPKEGLSWTYRGKAQFERLARSHVTQWILQRPALLYRRTSSPS